MYEYPSEMFEQRKAVTGGLNMRIGFLTADDNKISTSNFVDNLSVEFVREQRGSMREQQGIQAPEHVGLF